MIKITIHGEPKSKIRPRISRRKRISRRSPRVIMYDPLQGEKDAVKLLMSHHMQYHDIPRLQKGVSIDMIAYFSPAESLSKAVYAEKIWRANHTQKPDIDNIIKFYLDCANEIMFADDAQVVSITAVKRYSTNPRVIIKIEEIEMTEISEEDKKIIYTFTPKELEDFSNDCDNVSQFFKGSVGTAERGIDGLWASTASMLLSNFSNKWKSKLQKIGKQ